MCLYLFKITDNDRKNAKNGLLLENFVTVKKLISVDKSFDPFLSADLHCFLIYVKNYSLYISDSFFFYYFEFIQFSLYVCNCISRKICTEKIYAYWK